MRNVSKILALILAIAMLASVMVACGDDKKDGSAADSAANEPSVPGEKQTWGEITVFVPDSMTMEGGDGTFDPEDPKTVWLHDKENSMNYIKVTILDSEDNAKSNIETSKEINKEYNPFDVSVNFNDIFKWEGVAYNAEGTDCCALYCNTGSKVYYVMAGGYKENDKTMMEVLKSLI